MWRGVCEVREVCGGECVLCVERKEHVGKRVACGSMCGMKEVWDEGGVG